MRNLAIILIYLFPFVGFGQQINDENIYDEPKMYYESGIEPFPDILLKKQNLETPTKTVTATNEAPQRNFSEVGYNDFTTQRFYDNPKVYFEMGEEMASKGSQEIQSTEMATTNVPTVTFVPQKALPTSYLEDDYKLGRASAQHNPIRLVKTELDNFITIRVYQNPKVYYDIKVPSESKKTLFTIHHRPR